MALGDLLPTKLGGKSIRLGLPDAAKPCTAAAIATGHPGPTLFIASTPARAASMVEESALYLPNTPISRLPDRDGLPYEFLKDDPRTRMDVATALTAIRAGNPALVITSWSALSELRPGPSLQQAGVTVRTGDNLPPDELQSSLERRGYTVESMADVPGTVARRGGILDVFPVGAEHPARLEYFNDEVESIREVDLSTQRSVRRLNLLEMPPAATSSDDARAVSRELLYRLDAHSDRAETMLQELALIVEGGHSDYQTFFEPLLYEETALDHPHETCVVVVRRRRSGSGSARNFPRTSGEGAPRAGIV